MKSLDPIAGKTMDSSVLMVPFELSWTDTKYVFGYEAQNPEGRGLLLSVTPLPLEKDLVLLSHWVDCGTSCVTCCAVLLEPQLLDIMIVQFRNERVSNHGSIPITIDCNVVAFIVFEEGFHQPIKRTKQSVFLDETMFRHTRVD
ncbi:hypothetical protein TNCV_3961901 [Trichonephila clavipes]|nr:hypothetical protein TNCV_3961901 [Trichonephila clavipes]